MKATFISRENNDVKFTMEFTAEEFENAFDQKNFKKAEKGTDYFVAPVYLEMLLYKVKEICSNTTYLFIPSVLGMKSQIS